MVSGQSQAVPLPTPNSGAAQTDYPSDESIILIITVGHALRLLVQGGDQHTLMALYNASNSDRIVSDTSAAISILMSGIPFDYAIRGIKPEAARLIRTDRPQKMLYGA